MHRRVVCVVFLLEFLAVAAAVEAQTSTLSATADAYLKSGSPNQNQGSDTFLRIQSSGNNRVLVRFDPAAISAAVGDGSLDSARLELYVQNNSNNWGTEGRTMDAHRLAANWTESEVTWNCGIDANPSNSSADCTSQWAGGQFAEEPSDTVLHTNGLTGWVRFDVTADVRAFLSGTANHGWIIKKTEEGQSGQVDYTSRQGAADRAPRLVLVVESEAFDEVPPSLGITEPSQAVVVNDATPEIRIEYADGGSGVDLTSLQVLVDAADITGSCSSGATSATCEPPRLTAGTHTLQVRLSDQAGNESQASFAFELLVGPGLHTVIFSPVADTYLRQGTPNQNQGSESLLRVQAVGRNRTLMRFDPAAIASALAGATLHSAELELYVQTNGDNWGASGRAVNAHRLTSAWTESWATWNCADDANPANPLVNCLPQWNGGTFAAEATASVLHTKGLRGWVRFDVTSDLAAFLEGASNHGWLVKKADEWQSGRVDYTARTGAAAQAPRLVVTFELPVTDTTPPSITIEHPAEGALTNQATVEVRGTVADAGGIATVLVNGSSATLAGGTFAATVLLEEGFNEILVVATDGSNNQGFAGISVTLDTEPPRLALSSPREGQLVNGDSIQVAGEISDDSGIDRVTVDGTEIGVDGGLFTTDLQLQQEGPRAIVVAAVDLAGNSTQVTREVVRFSLPEVTITAPADLAFVAATTVEVTGAVSDGVAAVSVNGVPTSLAGTSFLAEDVPLIEGGNTVTATATDANGHVATATIHVVRDLTPPRVAIYRPAPGSVVRESTVSVSGLVNDIVPGTVNAAEATVTINGIPAEVVNRSFFVEAVPLAPGENTLVARAVDASGNAGEVRITVTLEAAAGPQVRVVSGSHQSGVIGTVLPQPLMVELLDTTGQPVAGRPVIFKVRENDGSLDGGRRQIVVTADAAGRAQATFTLGTRAGVANQVVEASSVTFAGPAVFTASALPAEPALIVVDSGGLQVGVAGEQVPRPLIAAVVDAGYNRLEGVPVVFQVVTGSGHFIGGSQETVVVTDSDGRAITTFTLDPEEGTANNQVEARVQGLEEGPSVSFVASGRAAGDPAGTAISGVVLDNTNVPIAGATLRLKHTTLTAVTDQEGQFRITGAPVGAVKLIVDGSTVSRPGSWPDLEFDLVTIAGRDNTVNMPIYLLPLDLGTSLPVDETRGGTLTLPQFPGFALEVVPGSVTYPGGGRSGVVSVTVVHNDKVPMVPNFGQQPRLIVTIQPAGARFDPPARLTLPNVDGLAPGKVTEMYSFDHDLGHFVSIGPATVSEDGTVLVSNPGVGIVKAGWHCGGDPATGVCLHQCPECSICRDPPCRCDIPKKLCTACKSAGSACDGNHKCTPGRDLIPKICDQLEVTITNQRPLPADDPLVQRLGCGADTCYAGMREDLTELTHSCDSISMAGARIHERVTYVSSGDCPAPEIIDRSTTCVVAEGPGNQLFSHRLGRSPCEDNHALCPPVSILPVGTCVITGAQTYSVDGCPATFRIVTYTFTKAADGSCVGSVH